MEERSQKAGTHLEDWYLFPLAILGFSFWFFMAVPFASHRESYVWLAKMLSMDFGDFVTHSVSSYRPLAQAATWLGFTILNPTVFPTSAARQALLQCVVYMMFAVAWFLLFSAAAQRRLFVLVALVAGGVFFSGYVHLFHIYGVFYVPIALIIGITVRLYSKHGNGSQTNWLALLAALLALWHPFATALFLGFYVGLYAEEFERYSRRQHATAWALMLLMAIAIAVLVAPRGSVQSPLSERLIGFVVSYRTNEVNTIASMVAGLFAILTVRSLGPGVGPKSVLTAATFVLCICFWAASAPLLILWIFVTLGKLVWMRRWAYGCMLVVAALLPLGTGIGAPIYGLFAIIVAAFVLPLGWDSAEAKLRLIDAKVSIAVTAAVLMTSVAVRQGALHIPVISNLAVPLLAEKERTYQLEQLVDWMKRSEYCAYDIEFLDKGDHPSKSVESAIDRRHRPPASQEDVATYWRRVKCGTDAERGATERSVMVTFGNQRLDQSDVIRELEGRYSGKATIWLPRARP
jgi:hypothetical protein